MPFTHLLDESIKMTYALGTWAFGGTDWGGYQDDRVSMRVMEALFSFGINHIDTAYDYGNGHSERLCGQFIADKKDRVFIATKGFIGKSKEGILKSLDRSLTLLGVDTIDLYYIHWPKAKVDMRPHMEGLEQARALGKIRYIGVSNFSVEQMEQVSEVGKVDAHQLCYNILWRKAEDAIIPYCIKHGIPLLAYSPLAQGLLTGKFEKKPSFLFGDNRPQTVFYDEPFCGAIFQVIARLKAICTEHDVSLFSVAIQWVLRQRGFSDVIVGVRTLEQASEYQKAIKANIPEAMWQDVNDLSNALLKKYPPHTNIFKYYP